MVMMTAAPLNASRGAQENFLPSLAARAMIRPSMMSTLETLCFRASSTAACASDISPNVAVMTVASLLLYSAFMITSLMIPSAP